MDDFEIEMESAPEETASAADTTGSESREVETPAETGDQHVDPSGKAEESDTFEEASDKGEASEEAPSDTAKTDDDLDAWAEKAGFGRPSTDLERKLLQERRDSQREFTRSHEPKKLAEGLDKSIKDQEATLDKPADTAKDNTSEARIAALERSAQEERTARLQSEFITEKKVTEAQIALMGTILEEKIAAAATPEEKRAELEYWSNPKRLQDWHTLAAAREMTSVGKEAIEAAAAQRERERLARESHATAPGRSSRSTVPQDAESELDKIWKD